MKCPNCEQQSGSPDWKAREHILWANGYGKEIRLFCDNCGQWTDFKIDVHGDIYKTEIIQKPHEPSKGSANDVKS